MFTSDKLAAGWGRENTFFGACFIIAVEACVTALQFGKWAASGFRTDMDISFKLSGRQIYQIR